MCLASVCFTKTSPSRSSSHFVHSLHSELFLSPQQYFSGESRAPDKTLEGGAVAPLVLPLLESSDVAFLGPQFLHTSLTVCASLSTGPWSGVAPGRYRTANVCATRPMAHSGASITWLRCRMAPGKARPPGCFRTLHEAPGSEQRPGV